MSVVIRPAKASEKDAIGHVNQSAFDGNAEANLIDALRDGGLIEVSPVADQVGEVVGHMLTVP